MKRKNSFPPIFFVHSSWKTEIFLTLFLLFCVPNSLGAASVSSGYIGINADAITGNFGLGTSPSYGPLPNADLTYQYPSPTNTNNITVMIDGLTYDFFLAPVVSAMTSVGSGLNSYIETVHSFPGGINLRVRYTIVVNPVTGGYADTAMLQYTFINTGGATVNLGLRVMIDTMVNNNDGANISVTNGVSTVTTNTVYRASSSNIPTEWWDYDVPPPGVATLVGHGSVYNNTPAYGLPPATMPDVMEIAHWPNVNTPSQWTLAAAATPITDSAVVLWWTGTGNESSGAIPLAPGATSQTFTTYYGMNQIALLTTPTMTNTFTITPTFTATRTRTETSTPTITPTLTSTPTPCGFPGPICTVTPTPVIVDCFIVDQNRFTPPSVVNITVCSTAYPGQLFLKIYNTAGEHVRTLEDRYLTAPFMQTYPWDGTNHFGEPCASGVYIIYAVEPLRRRLARVVLVR